MKHKKNFFIFSILVFISCLFFYQSIFFAKIPFPGDLLIAEYSPWKSYSFLGYNPGSYPNKGQYFDTIRQLYPWKTFVIDSLKKGQFPLWNPYNFSGSPLLANSQSAVLYPLNVFYFFLPQALAWSTLVFLQPLLAAFGTYLYAKKIGISQKGAFLAAIAYGFSLFMSVFLEYNTIGHVIAWLPFLLLSGELLLDRKTIPRTLLFLFSFVSCAFAGHLQIFGFIVIFVLIYFLARMYHLKKEQKRLASQIVFFAMLVLLGFGIAGIQLVPTFELIAHSARVNQSYDFLLRAVLIHPKELILFLSPDIFGNPATKNYSIIYDAYPGNSLYIGVIPFLFFCISFFKFKKNWFVSFFIISCATIALFLIKTPFTEIFYRLQIPFISTGSTSNAIFLLSFSLSILSGFGIDIWIQKEGKNITKILAVVAFIIFINLFYLLFFEKSIVSVKNLLLSVIIAVAFVCVWVFAKISNKKTIAVYFFIGITIIDLFYYFQKFNPFVPDQLVFPQTELFSWINQNAGINRYWGYAAASVQANFSTQYFDYSPDGYDPLYPKQYGQFIQASQNGKIHRSFDLQSRSDANILQGFGEKDFSQNPYRLKVLDILGVKYILDRVENGLSEKAFPPDQFRLIYNKDGWKIFENQKAAPRAFLTSKYKTYTTDDQFETLFFDKTFDPAKEILIKGNVGVPFRNSEEGNQLKIVSYTPNEVIFHTSSQNPVFLFLSDVNYPGWKAVIDNKEVAIYEADYAFRSLIVPPGEHRIVMRYQPDSFTLGKTVSLFTLLIAPIFLYFLINRSPPILYNKKHEK